MAFLYMNKKDPFFFLGEQGLRNLKDGYWATIRNAGMDLPPGLNLTDVGRYSQTSPQALVAGVSVEVSLHEFRA